MRLKLKRMQIQLCLRQEIIPSPAGFESGSVSRHNTDRIIELRGFLNSLATKKQKTKSSSANFQNKKIKSPSYIILRIQRLEGKQC